MEEEKRFEYELTTSTKVAQLYLNPATVLAMADREKGYLSTSVTVRDLVQNDITRLVELKEVESKVKTLAKSGEVLACKLHVTGGPDSATGFSHYNQDGILGQDDSLLSEHYMSLLLVAENGDEIWRNPNPQSDTFCRPRSLNWTKETDKLSKHMFDQFFREIDEMNENPLDVQISGITMKIMVSGMYTLIDGKVANAIVNNRNTHACPLCVEDADPRVGPSFFHSRLNMVEWLIRYAGKNKVEGHPALSHPDVKAACRKIADELEHFFKLHVNRPKIGGSGSSNNGNMARRLLADPGNFSRILGVRKDLVENLRLISSLALSSNHLDSKKVAELFKTIMKQLDREFPDARQIPPCIHKYKHLSEMVKRLPYTMNFVDEQAGERCHKRYKFTRPHLARKTSPEDSINDMMKTALAWSDVKFAHLDAKNTRKLRVDDEDFNQKLASFYASNEYDGDYEEIPVISASDDDMSSDYEDNVSTDSDDEE
ncbi:uncharacterized protein LOC135702117 [Ochlerotatus camptorhynchus]|uniref:uncharacterized protein LOC135702117 n=1 Tax=Ochlerotatus camptorhynchus TaxID=644619 RepID=UPI0031DC4431